jgi:hypothetical protein
VTVAEINLPEADEPLKLDDGVLDAYRAELESEPDPPPVRLAYAAAHAILDDDYAARGHSPSHPGSADEILESINWDATMGFRRHLASHGFGIAEAMDTAQRFALGWPAAEELIRRCGLLDLPHGFIAGAGTDHWPAVSSATELINAVCHQIQAAGGAAIILPMPWLTRWKYTADQYVEVYAAIIRQSAGPLFVHWLGEMFMAELRGYFPGDSFERVMDVDPAKVRGAKLSLLDAEREVVLRKRLLESDQIMLTGDDFNFADLIDGDSTEPTRWTDIGGHKAALGDFSHALLGIFDAIVEPAGLALRFLARGRRERYDALMRPCERLSRIIFEAPTQHYKTGLAFLSWLNGHQTNPMLVNGEETARDADHLLRVAGAASEAGAIRDASSAAMRLTGWLTGIERTPGRP